MKSNQLGVLFDSHLYYPTASIFSKNNFFYVMVAGEFFCNKYYSVNRPNGFSGYLILYVENGELIINSDGKAITVGSKQLALIDCNKPHYYYCKNDLHFLWIHFDGNVSKELFDFSTTNNGSVFSPYNVNIVKNTFESIIGLCQDYSFYCEPIISADLHRLLSIFMSPSIEIEERDKTITFIETAKKYIVNNLKENITLTDIANSANLSTYHFSRIFKKHIGVSPYEFLIRCRIDKSKLLLKTTSLSINDIATESGFNSESNFSSTFKQRVGISPFKFRTLKN